MDRAANDHIAPPVPVPTLYTGIPSADTTPLIPPQRQSFQNRDYASYPSTQPIGNSANSRTNNPQYGYDVGYSVVSQPPPGYEQ